MKQLELFERKIYFRKNKGFYCIDDCENYKPRKGLHGRKFNDVKIGSGACICYCRYCKEYNLKEKYVICDIK